MSNCFYSLLMKYAPAATSMPSVVIRNRETERGGAEGEAAEAEGEEMDCRLQKIRPFFFSQTAKFIPIHWS